MPEGTQARRSRGDAIKCIAVDSGKEMDRESFEGVVHILAELCYRAYREDHPEFGRSRDAGALPPEVLSKPDASGRLLNVAGLGKYLSIPKATIYSWTSTGKIPSKAIVRLGRSLRFDVKEIDAWVEESKALSRFNP